MEAAALQGLNVIDLTHGWKFYKLRRVCERCVCVCVRGVCVCVWGYGFYYRGSCNSHQKQLLKEYQFVKITLFAIFLNVLTSVQDGTLSSATIIKSTIKCNLFVVIFYLMQGLKGF